MQRSRVTCRAVAVSVLGLLWVVTTAFTCPERCDCRSDGKVDCSGRGFKDVPANIPLDTTILRLEHNNIQNLSVADFSYLTSLKELDLSNNTIGVLPAGVFSHLTRLRWLYLSDNNIADLPEGVFSHLTSLFRLHLSGNHIADLQDGVFSNLTSLGYLHLNNNNISSPPTGVFSHLTSLQELRLSDNHITELPVGVFENLTTLEELYLNNNNILSLPTGVFSHLTSLFRLYLSGNHIADLPDEVFSNLTSLHLLHLDNNNISSLPTGVFSHLTSLWELDLSGNHITDVPDGAFSHLISLTYLFLDNNNISSLSGGVFSQLTGLEWLWLSDNHIADLPEEVFSHLTSLDELRLENNNILSLPKALSNLTSLQILYIAGNPWRCDCNLHGLLTLKRLRDLIADDPTCNSPPHMKFSALTEIAEENVCQSRGDCTTGNAEGSCACNVGWTGTYCDKENLALGKKASQSSTFANGTGAEKAVDGSATDCAVTNREHQPWWQVDLAGYYRVSLIKITSALSLRESVVIVRVGPNENFTQNGQCRWNDTDGYGDLTMEAHCAPPMFGRFVSVQEMPPGDVEISDLRLCEVEVYQTDICCNHTISVLNGNITATDGYCSGNDIQFSCDPGYELVGRPSATCQEDGSWDGEIPTCHSHTVPTEQSPIGAIFGAVIGGIIGAIIVIVITAWKVGNFFIGWWRRKQVKEALQFLIDDEERTTATEGRPKPKYDVFISYSSTNASWVRDRLVADLENNRYRVCLDDRDFVPGQPVITNIVKAIYQSRKVILVMSQNFIKSGWCRYEFFVTYQRKLDLSENCVIVVKYDGCKIPKALASRTYLDWNKQQGNEAFWANLHASLGLERVSVGASCSHADPDDHGNVETPFLGP